MYNFIYSAKSNAFYPLEMIEQYIASGTWPTDGVKVSDDIYKEFIQTPPSGKRRIAGKGGKPIWADALPLSVDESIEAAENKKKELLNEVNAKTQHLQTQLMLGMINSDDKELLKKWMIYAQDLNKVDTSDIKKIEWPDLPL